MPETQLELASLAQIDVTPGIGLRVHHWQGGRPIVQIPGWPLTDERYDEQMSELARHGFAAFSISLQGYTAPTNPADPQAYFMYATDIFAITNHLDLHAVTLGKHAMGGAIAMPYTTCQDGRSRVRLALFGAPLLTRHWRDAAGPGSARQDFQGQIDSLDQEPPVNGDASAIDAALHSAGSPSWFVCQGRSDTAIVADTRFNADAVYPCTAASHG